MILNDTNFQYLMINVRNLHDDTMNDSKLILNDQGGQLDLFKNNHLVCIFRTYGLPYSTKKKLFLKLTMFGFICDRGSFNNYVDIILTFFDPPPVWTVLIP